MTTRADVYDIADRADFVLQFRALALDAGLSTRQLARMIDLPFTTVSGWLNGALPQPAQWPAFTKALAACGITASDEVAAWLAALTRARLTPALRPRTTIAPWRGLESYQPEDAELFFGREGTVARLIDLVDRGLNGRGARMIALVGPSGSGKSSILRAGLVATVRNGQLAATERCALLVPGHDPMGQLAEALRGMNDEVAAERSDLPVAAGSTDRQSAVIVVDQFEEIFTGSTDSRRAEFIDALSQLTSSDAAAAVVVLGLRADFYPHALREQMLAPVLQSSQLLVPPMSGDELRRAIVEPAKKAGITVGVDLIEILLRDVEPSGTGLAHDVGALPLFSHALLATWEQARTRKLTAADYLATGGLDQAIQRSAEQFYEALTSSEQEYTRRVFLQLVQIDEEMVVTRRRIHRSELLTLSPDSQAGIEDLLDQLVERRLVTAGAEVIEISHEALLTAWPRLHTWISENRQTIRAHRQLAEATRAWLDIREDKSGLLRGRRLEAAAELADAGTVGLTHDERRFLDASLSLEETERTATRRRIRRLQAAVAAATVLALASAVLAAVAAHLDARATSERDLAESRQAASESIRLRNIDPALAAQLALIAYRIAPTVEARSALIDSTALPLPRRVLGTASAAEALSPDRKILAISQTGGGSVSLWHMDGRNVPKKIGEIAPVKTDIEENVLAFNPGGNLLAAGNDAGTVQLYDVASPTHPVPVGQPLQAGDSSVGSIAFSHDGSTLCAAGDGGSIRRWTVTDPAGPLPLPPLPGPDNVLALTYNPDDTVLVVAGSDGDARAWNVSNPQHPTLGSRLQAGSETADTVAFSPNGNTLAIGSKDKTIRLWKVHKFTFTADRALSPFSSWVNALSFSPDGGILAAASSDQSTKLLDTSSWTVLESLPGPAPVTGVQFLADGHSLASVFGDGALRVWTLPGHTLTGATDSIFNLAFTRDGRTLIVGPGSDDNTIDQWNVSDRLRPAPAGPDLVGASESLTLSGSVSVSPDGRLVASGTLTGAIELFDRTDPAHPVPVGSPIAAGNKLIEATAFSPDGRVLAISSDDGTVRLWNVGDPATPIKLSTLIAPKGRIYYATFSPNGHLLAATNSENVARLYDITDLNHPRIMATLTGFTSTAYGAAFSSDGHLLAISSADKTIRMWNISDPEHPSQIGRALTGPTGQIYFVAISPDGRTLASADTAGAVWLWDIARPTKPVRLATLTAAAQGLFSTTFSPDGLTLAAAGTAKTVYLWDTDVGRAADDICAHVGDLITKAEWDTYLPGLRYRLPC